MDRNRWSWLTADSLCPVVGQLCSVCLAVLPAHSNPPLSPGGEVELSGRQLFAGGKA